MLDYRYFDFFAEFFISVKKARHQKVKDAPKLAEPVFDRRSRQGKANPAVHGLDRFSRGSGMGLYILCLVDDLIGKSFVGIIKNIPLQQVIGSYENVCFFRVFYLLLALVFASCDNGNRKLRREFCELLFPVVYQ